MSRGSGDFARYRDDPVAFSEDILGRPLWGAADSPTGRPGQMEVARALADPNVIDVAWGTCHGVGKTFFEANMALWWWCTRKDSIVVTTAPKWDQVKDLLWREIREAHKGARVQLPGIVTTVRAEMIGAPRWFMFGFSTDTPKGQETAVKAQGLHAKGGLLFLADEASGVPEPTYKTSNGYMTGGNAKRLLCGNQNHRYGTFFDALHSPTTDFSSFQTSAFDVPEEFNGQQLMSPAWIEKMKRECGPNYEESPLYQVQVKGQPPTSDAHGLISIDLLQQNEGLQPALEFRSIGVDIARFGDDKSVAYLNDRGRIKARHQWEHARTNESATIIRQLMEKWDVPNAEDVHVDSTGLGAGVVDDLFNSGYYVDPVEFGAGPSEDWDDVLDYDLYEFRNRRCELHFIAWKLLQLGWLSIPKRYQQAWADAIAIRLLPDDRYFKVESKQKMKERIGRSPDDLDAILCSLSKASVAQSYEGEGFVVPGAGGW